MEEATQVAKAQLTAIADRPEVARRVGDGCEISSSITKLGHSRAADVDLWVEGLARGCGAELLDVCALMDCGEYVEIEMQPIVADPAGEMVRQASVAAERGAEIVVFTGLDSAPRAAVTWAKQAARFARRAAG